MNWRVILITTCIFILLACAQDGTAGSVVHCGDFLSTVSHKPDSLIFIGCEKDPDAQIGSIILRASYKVRGSKAALVEKYLVRISKMKRLSFACCVWYSGNAAGQLKDARGNIYYVDMGSEDTLYSSRNQWTLIPWFYVDVKFYLEGP